MDIWIYLLVAVALGIAIGYFWRREKYYIDRAAVLNAREVIKSQVNQVKAPSNTIKKNANTTTGGQFEPLPPTTRQIEYTQKPARQPAMRDDGLSAVAQYSRDLTNYQKTMWAHRTMHNKPRVQG